MACRGTAPNHYLNQCWNIVNWTPRNKLQWNFSWNSNIFNQENALENVVCEMASILCRPPCVNTSRPGQNGRHFSDDTFKCIFLNENLRDSIQISPKFVPKGPVNDIPVLVQIMAWHQPGDEPLSEPMMVRLSMHICITQPQWVKVMSHVCFCISFLQPPDCWFKSLSRLITKKPWKLCITGHLCHQESTGDWCISHAKGYKCITHVYAISGIN